MYTGQKYAILNYGGIFYWFGYVKKFQNIT